MAEQEQRCSLTKHMELARVALSTIQGHMQVKSIPWAKASNIHDFPNSLYLSRLFSKCNDLVT